MPQHKCFFVYYVLIYIHKWVWPVTSLFSAELAYSLPLLMGKC